MTNKILFNRKWRLTVGQEGQQGNQWEGLKMVFKVEKSRASSPNKLTMSVNNLKEKSRNKFIKGSRVFFEAGYNIDFGIIFDGTIEKVNTTERQETEIITSFEAKDAIKELREKIVSKSFNAETELKTVIDYLIEQMGVTKGTIKDIPNYIYSKGLQVFGNIKQNLDEITKTHGITYYINDGVIQINSGGVFSDTAILLNNSTGLLSVIPTDKGYTITSLLRPGLNPGSRVKIESSELKGIFQANNIVHRGDTLGNEYFTEIDIIK